MSMGQESFLDSIRSGLMRLPTGLRWIIVSTFIVFLLQTIVGIFGGVDASRWITLTFGLMPHWSDSLSQPWRLFTYMLLHAGGFHILFNMLWLWWMGQAVETTIGSRNFLIVYIGAGVGGALINLTVSAMFGMTTFLPTVGASGAVFGVMVAFAMLYPTAPIMLLLLPPIQARYVVAGLIALDVLFLTANDNVARIVHIGGAFSGWALMRVYATGGFETMAALVRSYQPMKGPKNKRMRPVADAVIIEEIDQSEIDRILDKIAQKGYSSLTAEEKRKLFDSSKT